MRQIIRFTENDNVAIVLDDMKEGQKLWVSDEEIVVRDKIPYGHKIALTDLEKGEFVVKYGEPVARVTQKIQKGDWVHIHNVESIRGLGR